MKWIVCGVLGLLGLAALSTGGYAAEVDTTKRGFDQELTRIHTGTAKINTNSATWTNWTPLITITPESLHTLNDAKVFIDLALVTTGFAATYTSGTIQATVARKVDGTNWRVMQNAATTALSGANAAGSGLEINLGLCSPGEAVAIWVKLSATGNSNTVFPYAVYYRSGATAAFTPAN